MYQVGDLRNKWTGMGHLKSDDYKIYYSGHESIQRNEATMKMKKDFSKYVFIYNPINNKDIFARISGYQVNINVIQIYAPTKRRKTLSNSMANYRRC